MMREKFSESNFVTSVCIVGAIVTLNRSWPILSDEIRTLWGIRQAPNPIAPLKDLIPKFIHLSYLNPSTGDYYKGWDDLYFVIFWVLVWLILRGLLMQIFWNPLGKSLGLKKPKKLQRFSEQGWILVYCSVFWCMGVKILSGYTEPILSLNIRQYWQGYPRTSMSPLCKFYYLSQIAFWFQQIIVLHIEKRRKDHCQMLAHHIVTIFLVCGSYATNFTDLGMAVHTTMDLSDILLALSKMLNYLQIRIVGDVSFLAFVLSWLYTRHYVLVKIIWAIYHELPEDIGFSWNPKKGYLANYPLWIVFMTLLSSLEILLIIWLFMILNVLWKVMKGKAAQDSRSDSEDSDDEPQGGKLKDMEIASSREKNTCRGNQGN